MNENITPTVVLEDIAWGEGLVEVPTYGGTTRQGTKVNLSNIPFDATKTVAQAMEEMISLLNSQDYASVQANLTSLITIKNNLQQLLDVKNQLDHILNVSNDMSAIRAISARLPLLDNIEELISNIDKHTRYVEYALCQMKRDREFIRKDIGEARELVYGKIEPLVEAVTQARLQLDTIIATAREDVCNGHEMAVKLATYSLEIQAKPYCMTPKVIVDDINRRIIWQVPTVKGDCSVMDSIPTELVQSAVDNYLITLSNVQGSIDEPITQDRVDEAFGIVDNFKVTINISGDILDTGVIYITNEADEVVVNQQVQATQIVELPAGTYSIDIDQLANNNNFDVSQTSGVTPFTLDQDITLEFSVTLSYIP